MLSIVVRTFRDWRNLPGAVRSLEAFAAQADWAVELIAAVARNQEMAISDAAGDGVRVVGEGTGCGQGSAARRGMLAARGRFRLLTDVDLWTPIDEVYRLLVEIAAGHDVVVGRPRPAPRHGLAGRLLTVVAGPLAPRGVRVPLSGFVLFSAAAAVAAFAPARLAGRVSDVEALRNAHRAGFRICEVGVKGSGHPAGPPSAASAPAG